MTCEDCDQNIAYCGCDRGDATRKITRYCDLIIKEAIFIQGVLSGELHPLLRLGYKKLRPDHIRINHDTLSLQIEFNIPNPYIYGTNWQGYIFLIDQYDKTWFKRERYKYLGNVSGLDSVQWILTLGYEKNEAQTGAPNEFLHWRG